MLKIYYVCHFYGNHMLLLSGGGSGGGARRGGRPGTVDINDSCWFALMHILYFIYIVYYCVLRSLQYGVVLMVTVVVVTTSKRYKGLNLPKAILFEPSNA